MTPTETSARRWLAQLEWVLLPLRIFLGIVFLDGGISKIADVRFLDGTSPTSMHATVVAVRRASPIGSLLGPVADHSFAFGLLMAAAEIAVGLGLLLGLFTRVAAAGGMVLALSLWLTVSWQAEPWFTSADIVYVMALSPFLLAGGAPTISLDGWLAAQRRRQPSRSANRSRRAFLGAATALFAGVIVGTASLFRRSSGAAALGPKPVPSGTASADVLAKSSDVPVGGGLQVTDPQSGDAVWILQLTAGQFSAYKAACPHQGCPVRFISPAAGFACPCHGSTFDATGKVENGPAQRNLTSISVTSAGGQIRSS
jgi:thiosulfate dehydrogenase (quinone) large subunit